MLWINLTALAVFSLLFMESSLATKGEALPGRSCFCTPREPDVRWQSADAVFEGTVTEIKAIEKMTSAYDFDPPVKVTLQVDQPYKGADKNSDFVISTSLTRFTCAGYPFEKDAQYLVYAYQRKEGIRHSTAIYNFPFGSYDVGGLCGGTKELSDPATAADLKSIKRMMAAEHARGGVFNQLRGIFEK